MYNIKQSIDEWERSRMATISSLRRSAAKLLKSHRNNAEEEHTSAKASLTGDAVGVIGVALAPFSGGLSLAAVVVSSSVGVGSFINKYKANKQDEKTKREVNSDVERAVKRDTNATECLKNCINVFGFLEEKLCVVDDIIIKLEQSTVVNIKINTIDIKSGVQIQLQQNNDLVCIPGLDLSRQAANLKAALTSAEQVVKCTRITKEVYRGTRTIQQVVSTAQSLNHVTQTAKSLATAKQAAVVTIRASKSVAKSATAFTHVARGANRVVINAGVVASMSKSTGVAVGIVTASGQTASVAKAATIAAKAGTAISSVTKGADTTIKTVVRTTRLTTNVSRVTKVSETVTKAASISKIGFAINAVVIPLDIYNLIQAKGNLNKSFDDVKSIEDLAESLEKEMKKIINDLKLTWEQFTTLHVQLLKVCEDHHIEVIYDYLQLLNITLDLRIPKY